MKNIHPFIKFILKTVLHTFFWVAVYFFYTYFLGYGSNNIKYVNEFSAFLMPTTIIVSYFFLYYLIPNYLQNKKYFLFVLYSIYTFIIATCFLILSILYGFILLENTGNQSVIPLTKSLPFIILGVYMVVLFIIVIGLIGYNYLAQVKTEDLKNKFLETQLQLKEQELKFLKMQIHPHFLFNSLNTIYGFAIAKADEAPEMILKLSNLLDYILYQVEKPKVFLTEEINHLEDYISLEKMRFHDTLKVNFKKENIGNTFQIPPMLLIPFVENSFKHGVLINGVLTVDIQLKIDENFLFFEVENSSIIKDEATTGIGLENIKKRLEMLYPKKHQLAIIDKNDTFKVSLKIEF
ncbi:sensor histidine kinase [Polaribacter sargassicola]|uniref:sensor histidine kinase n=1 Tax=Polaribacter sargassicola TaxID=2836891 RepID=UPI001F00BAB8|nr:histidine kinase [Polaribacter sp. DS7-9]MCG1035980.1 histidine kinase [Polaribacter sp. DS7-9]